MAVLPGPWFGISPQLDLHHQRLYYPPRPAGVQGYLQARPWPGTQAAAPPVMLCRYQPVAVSAVMCTIKVD